MVPMDGSILAMNHRYTITPQIIHGFKTPHLNQPIQHGGTFGSKIEQKKFQLRFGSVHCEQTICVSHKFNMIKNIV